MKATMVIGCFLLIASAPLRGQYIPGMTYCLLFDSNVEKLAFQNTTDDCDPMSFLLAHDPKFDSTHFDQAKNNLGEFAEKIIDRRRSFNSELKFLRYVFFKVHREYLREYKKSETFSGILNGGRYNCVTGVALYGYLLTELGYKPKIFETRFHIFLIVDFPDIGQILFEATDPQQGFVSNQNEVQKRIAKYLLEEQHQLANPRMFSAPFNNSCVFKAVTLKEVAGLHYYNLAVDLSNNGHYYDAFRACKKAGILYPQSVRIKHLTLYIESKYRLELSKLFAANLE